MLFKNTMEGGMKIMVEFITMAPTGGDGEYVGAGSSFNKEDKNVQLIRGESGERQPTFEYIRDVAQAAEKAGFSTLLLPTGQGCLDSLAVASNLVTQTTDLNFLFAVRPGSMSPSSFAKQFATVDYWSNGRARVNVVTGGSPVELASQGDFLDHRTRYQRTREYIQILKKYFSGEKFTHEGKFFTLKDTSLYPELNAVPNIYFGGASDVGKDVAAAEADVYMLWGETLEKTKEQIEDMKKRSAANNRELSYSVSFQVILGETEAKAYENAHKLLSKTEEAVLEQKKEVSKKGEAVGVKRLYSLMEESKDNNFIIGPNIWAGLAQVLPGNSIALVGTPEQVTDRIVEFVELGFDKVLLRGFPHLETIEAIGELIIPKVREKLARGQGV